MTRRTVLALFALGLARPAFANGTLVIRGKLTGMSESIHCGILHTAAVMRYEVLEVIDGAYSAKVLYAVFDCGWVAGKPQGVKVGEVHKLTVRPLPTDFAASIFDDFASDKSVPRFLAIRAE